MERPSNITPTAHTLEPQPTGEEFLPSDDSTMAKGKSPSGKVSISEKIRAKISKLRKKPHVSNEQKLQAKIDSLNAQASELHGECTRLQEKAASFTSRAETTPAPAEAPPKRDALFERASTAPPGQYEAQLTARNLLLGDWHLYEKDVRGHAKKLERFAETVEGLKRETVKPGRAMGKVEHHFEGLENAVFNLREQRAELGKVVSAVPLPVGQEVIKEEEEVKDGERYPHALPPK